MAFKNGARVPQVVAAVGLAAVEDLAVNLGSPIIPLIEVTSVSGDDQSYDIRLSWKGKEQSFNLDKSEVSEALTKLKSRRYSSCVLKKFQQCMIKFEIDAT